MAQMYSPGPSLAVQQSAGVAGRAQLRTDNKVLRDFAASGTAVCFANVATNPIEVIKTRMMLREKASLAALSGGGSSLQPHLKLQTGFLATGTGILHNEGPRALFRGVQASALRGITFGGIRLGLYGPIKDLIATSSSTSSSSSSSSSQPQQQAQLSFSQKLLAGSISGGVGAYITNPLELIKTRCQAAGGPGPMAVARGVLQQHGVAGLWHGATPGVLRSTLLNAAMCATYDESKLQVQWLTGWSKDGLATTFTASMASGLVTTTVINPVDVVRAYMQTGRSAGASTVAVAQGILQQEGVGGFMKGWSAAYMRTGPQCVMIFLASEVLRPLFGLKQIA